MNDSRHQELLGRVLDDELTPADTDELTDWLRQDPAGRSEVRKHLQLWELFGQQVRAERSAGAFVEACRTRLVAESDERKFVRETERRLLRSVKRGGNKATDQLLLLRQWIARWLPSPRWALAAGVVMLCVLVLPGLLRTQGLPELATVTDGEVQIMRGNQSVQPEVWLRLQPTDVIRTTQEGEAVISYGREATRIEIKPSTEVKFLTWGQGKHFDLRAGKLQASVARQRLFRPMVILTPTAEARVLGTKFTLTTTTNATRLDVAEGKVRLTRSIDGAGVDVPKDHYAIAGTNVNLAALPQTGAILREIWTGIPGGEVNDLLEHPSYPSLPAHRDLLKALETGVIKTNNYACRLIGYVHPPVTGDYTFWIASGGYAALWLSPDENPVNKARIAAAFGGLPQQWDPPNPQGKFQMPQSPKVRLVAGQRYFIQAIQKTATGSSHLEVAWNIPGAERAIISGEFLSPYKPKD